MEGTIKRIVPGKPFGFITVNVEGGEQPQPDVFFHQDACVEVNFADLKEGDKVTFDVEQAEKEPRAKNVRRV